MYYDILIHQNRKARLSLKVKQLLLIDRAGVTFDLNWNNIYLPSQFPSCITKLLLNDKVTTVHLRHQKVLIHNYLWLIWIKSKAHTHESLCIQTNLNDLSLYWYQALCFDDWGPLLWKQRICIPIIDIWINLELSFGIFMPLCLDNHIWTVALQVNTCICLFAVHNKMLIMEMGSLTNVWLNCNQDLRNPDHPRIYTVYI